MNHGLRECERVFNQARPHDPQDNLTPHEYIQSLYSHLAPQLSQMY